jgi:hypothetical protein
VGPYIFALVRVLSMILEYEPAFVESAPYPVATTFAFALGTVLRKHRSDVTCDKRDNLTRQ